MSAPKVPKAPKASRKLMAGGSVRSVNFATSPLLASKTPQGRSRFIVATVGFAFALLLGLAFYRQIVATDFYRQQGEKRYAHTMELPASRGRILDRNGQVLAASVATPSVWAIPKDFRPSAEQKAGLVRLLAMSPADLDTRLAVNPNFAWLRRQVDEPVWAQIAALGIEGVHSLPEYRRAYPEGETAAHVVGFTDTDESGVAGIEKAFESELEGQDGTRTVVKDRMGRIVDEIGQRIDAADGRDVRLSIDARVQFVAYRRLGEAVAHHKAKAGSVVVLDALTGEVLALANVPSFDPADRLQRSGEQVRNRALTDTFEPGSTMKPFIAALAIETRRVTPATVIQTAPGKIYIDGQPIGDSHPHGALTVAEVIQKSSNVGTVKMAMQMPPSEMWAMYTAVGLGRKPQIEFPGAVAGRLRPWKTWKRIEQATMSYGYGLSVSLLQLAHAYTVFARDGELIPLSIQRQERTVEGTRVMSQPTAAAVREMLHSVTLPGGTAIKAQAIGYSVGGKTGTAYKQVGRNYRTDKYRAWFVGIAPVVNPRIVVAVMVDEPGNGEYFGGDVAAPVFSQVVQQTLQILQVAPDIDVKQQIAIGKLALPLEQESFQ